MIVSLSYVTIKTEHFCSLSLNLCSQLALDWRTRRTRCCWRCHRSCWRLPITWSWAATSTGQCCYPKGSACTPTSRSPSSSRKTPTSPMATGPTCPPSCVSEGGKDISKCDIFAPVSWINVWVSSALQHFYPVQWDREHLEPPSRFPALLLSGGQRPFVCPASLWSQQGRLCHLCDRTLLLPGNSRLTEDLSEPFRTPIQTPTYFSVSFAAYVRSSSVCLVSGTNSQFVPFHVSHHRCFRCDRCCSGGAPSCFPGSL